MHKGAARCAQDSDRSEWLYMQADLPEGSPLFSDVNFTSEPFTLILQACSGTSDDPPEHRTHGAHAFQVTQQPRLWLSPQGAVSPLHYDRSVSLLTQAMGSKRMLFFAPEDLDTLMPFPNDHMLARRCSALLRNTSSDRIPFSSRDMSSEGLLPVEDESRPGERSGVRVEEDRVLEGLAGQEVVLDAGDVVVFGPYWAHWTASETVSASVTLRVGAQGQSS